MIEPKGLFSSTFSAVAIRPPHALLFILRDFVCRLSDGASYELNAPPENSITGSPAFVIFVTAGARPVTSKEKERDLP
jgi:hypothetical protein